MTINQQAPATLNIAGAFALHQPNAMLMPHISTTEQAGLVSSASVNADPLDKHDREVFVEHPEVNVYVRAFRACDDRGGSLQANLADSFGATVICRSGFRLAKFWHRRARLAGRPVDLAISAARIVARNYPEAGLMGSLLGSLAISECIEALG